MGLQDEFSKIYEAFEYALVRDEFRIAASHEARPDWIKFSQAVLRDEFFEEVRLKDLARTLISKPPRKLLNRDGAAEWDIEVAAVTNTLGLIHAVRQVRHNLRHGNKYIGDDEEIRRSDALISDAINVLNLALKKSSDALREQINKRIALFEQHER